MDLSETVRVLSNFFDSRSVNLNGNVLVQPEKPDKAVAAEDRGDSRISGGFEPFLEILIRTRRTGSGYTGSGMTVEMCQQPVSELLQFDEEPMCGPGVPDHAHRTPLLM